MLASSSDNDDKDVFHTISQLISGPQPFLLCEAACLLWANHWVYNWTSCFCCVQWVVQAAFYNGGSWFSFPSPSLFTLAAKYKCFWSDFLHSVLCWVCFCYGVKTAKLTRGKINLLFFFTLTLEHNQICYFFFLPQTHFVLRDFIVLLQRWSRSVLVNQEDDSLVFVCVCVICGSLCTAEPGLLTVEAVCSLVDLWPPAGTRPGSSYYSKQSVKPIRTESRV